MAGHHGSILRDLAPALCFFEGAAGKAAPMRRIGDALHCVFVPGDAGVHDDGGHLRLLDEILGSASAEINDAGGFRLSDDTGGLHYRADHVERESITALVTIGRDADSDGAVGDGRTV